LQLTATAFFPQHAHFRWSGGIWVINV